MKDLVNRIDRWLDESGEKLKKHEWEIPLDLTGGILFLIVGIAIMVIIPQQIVVKKKEVINGQAFPRLLVFLMIGCSLILIVREVIKLVRHEELRKVKLNLLVEIRALIIFVNMLVYYVICKVTGQFLIGSCVFVVLMLFFFRCKKWHYYAITLAAAVFIWVAFHYGLNVNF